MNGKLFGVADFSLDGDGIIYDAVIERVRYTINPKECEGYLCLYMMVLTEDRLVENKDTGVLVRKGYNESLYPMFKANTKNISQLLYALGKDKCEFNLDLNQVLNDGMKIRVSFGTDSEGTEFIRIYGVENEFGGNNIGEITYEGV